MSSCNCCRSSFFYYKYELPLICPFCTDNKEQKYAKYSQPVRDEASAQASFASRTMHPLLRLSQSSVTLISEAALSWSENISFKSDFSPFTSAVLQDELQTLTPSQSTAISYDELHHDHSRASNSLSNYFITLSNILWL